LERGEAKHLLLKNKTPFSLLRESRKGGKGGLPFIQGRKRGKKEKESVKFSCSPEEGPVPKSTSSPKRKGEEKRRVAV